MSPKLTVVALILFLVGFGLLLFSFLELLNAIRKSKEGGFGGRKNRVWLRVVCITGAAVMIGAAQILFWFNSGLKQYATLDRNVPLANISFIKSETERPRMVLKIFDEHNQPLIADEIILEDSIFQIEMEVIKFKKLGNLFGLDEVYRFSRIIYVTDYVNDSAGLKTTPLVDDEKALSDYIRDLRKIMTIAFYKTVLTDPLKLDESSSIDLTYNDLGIINLLPQGTVSAERDSE